MEKSYHDISKDDCARMLNLSPSKLDEFLRERGWSNDQILFGSNEDVDKKWAGDHVPTKDLAHMVLSYAKEMEKIV